MKNLVYILSLLILASCGDADSDVANTSTKGNTSNLESKAPLETNAIELDFSNPGVFMGSDFGGYFRALYKLGKYDEMISFTSKESIDEFGEDAVRDFYENELQFGYEIGRAKSKNVKDGVTTLNYNANIDATKVVVRINVVIENDSCKIVLPNKLKNFPS